MPTTRNKADDIPELVRAASAGIDQMLDREESRLIATNSPKFGRGVEIAMRKAAAEARRVAIMHGTPL